MFYTIYKTTNLVNNKIYIGKHSTKDLNDGYMGSGTWLLQAFDKYGIANFSKELLHVFDTEELMNTKEAELVTEAFCLATNTYNICRGGQGGFSYINRNTHLRARGNWFTNGKENAYIVRGRIVPNGFESGRIVNQHLRKYIGQCKNCGKDMGHGLKKLFCSRSCSAKFNNKKKIGSKLPVAQKERIRKTVIARNKLKPIKIKQYICWISGNSYTDYKLFVSREFAGLKTRNSRTIRLLASVFGIELPNRNAANLFVEAIIKLKEDYESGLSSLQIRKLYNIQCSESHCANFLKALGIRRRSFVQALRNYQLGH